LNKLKQHEQVSVIDTHPVTDVEDADLLELFQFIQAAFSELFTEETVLRFP
jgi:hypothetical protein